MPKIPIAASALKPSRPAGRDSHDDATTDQEPLPAALETKFREYVLTRRTSMTDVDRESTEEN